MANYSFSRRIDRLNSTAGVRRSTAFSAPTKTSPPPRVGPKGFDFKLIGTESIDETQGVSFNAINAAGLVAYDGFYYNSASVTTGTGATMNLYINDVYRATIEFATTRIGTEFGYKHNHGFKASPISTYGGLPFTDYDIIGTFAQGDVFLIDPNIVIPPAPPEPEPEPEPEPGPPPTPEPTEEIFSTPEPTPTDNQPTSEPTQTPQPTQTPEPTSTPAV